MTNLPPFSGASCWSFISTVNGHSSQLLEVGLFQVAFPFTLEEREPLRKVKGFQCLLQSLIQYLIILNFLINLIILI